MTKRGQSREDQGRILGAKEQKVRRPWGAEGMSVGPVWKDCEHGWWELVRYEVGASARADQQETLSACRGLWVFLHLVESQRWDVHRGGATGSDWTFNRSLWLPPELADASTMSYNCHSFFVTRTFKICFLHDFDVCNTVLLTINVILGCNTVLLTVSAILCLFPQDLLTLELHVLCPLTNVSPFLHPGSWELPFHSVSTSWNFYIPPRSDILYKQNVSVCLCMSYLTSIMPSCVYAYTYI